MKAPAGASLLFQPAAPVLDVNPRIVMRQDGTIIEAILCHGVCAVLAHAHAVAVALGGDAHIIPHEFDGEVGAREVERLAELPPGSLRAAQPHGFDPAARVAGSDLHLCLQLFRRKARLGEGRVELCEEVPARKGRAFRIMRGALFAGAFHAHKVWLCARKHVFRALRHPSRSGMIERLDQRALIGGDLACRAVDGFRDARGIIGRVRPPLFGELIWGTIGLAAGTVRADVRTAAAAGRSAAGGKVAQAVAGEDYVTPTDMDNAIAAAIGTAIEGSY